MATAEVTEKVTEQVAEHLEEAAEVTRSVDPRAVKFLLIGMAPGVVLGFFLGYRYNREKIRAEAFAKSEEEVAKIREVYQEGRREVAPEKPPVEELIEEKGYITPEPPTRPLAAPVPIIDDAPVVVKKDKDKDEGWNYSHELSRRTTSRPYILHQDEFQANESDYTQVTYTYYSGDDVLADEDETVIPNINETIGTSNLRKWGHGADDYDVLYLRNPVLEIEIELCRVPKSYEEEIGGLERSEE
jgi:hypothetical protein